MDFINKRTNYSALIYKNNLFIIGGKSEYECLKTIETIDLSTFKI